MLIRGGGGEYSLLNPGNKQKTRHHIVRYIVIENKLVLLNRFDTVRKDWFFHLEAIVKWKMASLDISSIFSEASKLKEKGLDEKEGLGQ